jgi:hypothetical protein
VTSYRVGIGEVADYGWVEARRATRCAEVDAAFRAVKCRARVNVDHVVAAAAG